MAHPYHAVASHDHDTHHASHDHDHVHSCEHGSHDHASQHHDDDDGDGDGDGDDDDDEVHRQEFVMRRLKTASALCVTFLLVEVTGGYLAGSLAILSDAAHLLADLAAFAVAIAASHLGSLPTTDQHTFGLKRMESLAALFSMVCLALVSIGLAVEAVRRLLHPPEQLVDGPLMSGIAAIGVVVNVILALVLGEHHVHMPGSHDHDHDCEHGHQAGSHNHEHSNNHDLELTEESVLRQHADELLPPNVVMKKARNINLHAAYIHVLGDLAQSVAVLLAGCIIWFQPNWQVVDPICTLGFCALVFYSTLGVLRSSISVLLEEVPPNVSWKRIHEDIESVEGVTKVHDLHIWSISHGVPTLSVHCTCTFNPQRALEDIYGVCEKHGIVHATIQVQQNDGKCITCHSDNKKQCHSLQNSD
jgi:zinc transporter 2